MNRKILLHIVSGVSAASVWGVLNCVTEHVKYEERSEPVIELIYAGWPEAMVLKSSDEVEVDQMRVSFEEGGVGPDGLGESYRSENGVLDEIVTNLATLVGMVLCSLGMSWLYLNFRRKEGFRSRVEVAGKSRIPAVGGRERARLGSDSQESQTVGRESLGVDRQMLSAVKGMRRKGLLYLVSGFSAVLIWCGLNYATEHVMYHEPGYPIIEFIYVGWPEPMILKTYGEVEHEEMRGSFADGEQAWRVQGHPDGTSGEGVLDEVITNLVSLVGMVLLSLGLTWLYFAKVSAGSQT